MQAHDRPTPFKPKVYFGPTTPVDSSTTSRMGYFFKPCWSVSFGVDHMKYVMDANQTLRGFGIITRKRQTNTRDYRTTERKSAQISFHSLNIPTDQT
ncbi:MAG: hypothetical protein R2792_05795 [Saprospiraceae bacterium]